MTFGMCMKSFLLYILLYIFSWFGESTYMQRGWHESAKLGSRRNANVKRGVKYITFFIIYHIPYMSNISLSSSAWFTNHHHHHHLCCYHHHTHRHPAWLQTCSVLGLTHLFLFILINTFILLIFITFLYVQFGVG